MELVVPYFFGEPWGAVETQLRPGPPVARAVCDWCLEPVAAGDRGTVGFFTKKGRPQGLTVEHCECFFGFLVGELCNYLTDPRLSELVSRSEIEAMSQRQRELVKWAYASDATRRGRPCSWTGALPPGPQDARPLEEVVTQVLSTLRGPS